MTSEPRQVPAPADPADPGGAGTGATGAAPVSIWNLANGVTTLRVALVPVFGWLALHDGAAGWRVAAAVVFAVAVATDRLDGELARRRGLVTDLGKIADPIADKALIGTALVALSLLGELSWWVTGVILVREVLVTAVRVGVLRYGVIPAGRGGKAKTALQALAITLYLLPPFWVSRPAGAVVMAVVVVVTVVTGVQYLVRAARLVAGTGR